MNKIRVIDLLNKMANGEEIPKEIRVYDKQYKYNDKLKVYAWGNGQLCYDYFIENNKLNDEIEIIEEDKNIEKMDRELNCDDDTIRGLVASVNEIYKEIADKINEIIDKLNEGVDKE